MVTEGRRPKRKVSGDPHPLQPSCAWKSERRRHAEQENRFATESLCPGLFLQGRTLVSGIRNLQYPDATVNQELCLEKPATVRDSPQADAER